MSGVDVNGRRKVPKSLALQRLKLAMDGKQVIAALRAAGHPVNRADVVVDLIFGTGMAPAWQASMKVTLAASESPQKT